MTTWRVRVQERRVWTVEVEAPSLRDAENVAAATEPHDAEVERTADALQQLDEPWVAGRWYDVNCTDIVVCERSFGNRFTKAEVATLSSRLEALGWHVVDFWNGEGYGTVSFKCTGRKGTEPMTEAELATLLAPMENKP